MNPEIEFFTAGELARMALPGMPKTDRGMRDKAVRDAWDYIEAKGQGPNGVVRKFRPPAHILALIEARRRGELLTQDVRPALARQSEAEEPAAYTVAYRDLVQIVEQAAARADYDPPALHRDLLVIGLMHGLDASVIDVMLGLLKAQAILDQSKEQR